MLKFLLNALKRLFIWLFLFALVFGGSFYGGMWLATQI